MNDTFNKDKNVQIILEKIGSIKDNIPSKPSFFQKLFVVLEKIMIPVLLGILALIATLSSNKIVESQKNASIRIANAQLELAKEQESRRAQESNQLVQIKLIELFYKDISATEESRQLQAISLLKLMDINLAEKLGRWAQTNQNISPIVQKRAEETTSELLKDTSKDIISTLRNEEQIDKLIWEGNYKQALNLDANNVIANMRYIRQLVQQGNYKEAIKYIEPLQRGNQSGVGYSVYPFLVLALDKVGSNSKDHELLIELENNLDKEFQSGYLSASELEFLIKDVELVLPKLSNQQSSKRLEDLLNKCVKLIPIIKKKDPISELIRERKYEEALKLDPKNEYVISQVIKEKVKNRQYKEALSYYEQLRNNIDSSVGYNAFPDLILAFEKTGQSKRAINLITDLNLVIKKQLSKGYGYYSRSMQL